MIYNMVLGKDIRSLQPSNSNSVELLYAMSKRQKDVERLRLMALISS